MDGEAGNGSERARRNKRTERIHSQWECGVWDHSRFSTPNTCAHSSSTTLSTSYTSRSHGSASPPGAGLAPSPASGVGWAREGAEACAGLWVEMKVSRVGTERILSAVPVCVRECVRECVRACVQSPQSPTRPQPALTVSPAAAPHTARTSHSEPRWRLSLAPPLAHRQPPPPVPIPGRHTPVRPFVRLPPRRTRQRRRTARPLQLSLPCCYSPLAPLPLQLGARALLAKVLRAFRGHGVQPVARLPGLL